ncbi:putative U6 snRNA-associated Sm-like protein LSm1 [Monocercomonoides exilis]|uniref:putative U6 snRNA-associated Sm-like protein LSm1 n=1 Tax=Monocercomonoides exilis TaxID=2049356 RepID=UPI0035598945|nr:putative U6 snRNA-associated Sm-like protein LSm1 [Monocercomonoides exilis]|eukprot:MONOS_5767.1-p1 / transcript=MONOS_5767.1 / gene=MONOS_5767 / organism=Monocercomonoides_exilis_PA203 / gene_product=U6 snRNA-associated Sm-like protein LSm1 / transcript_product=U6 snRNA-associated Sm-like protein LSm1 / location=Mono_scaffold00172:85056-85626(-) / protein_length=130 / sequence_SO=supercontig / SO=protein_coding / is_pseudo=false
MACTLSAEVDTYVIVHTRDNKVILGWMRTFDAFTNVVLEGAVERIMVDDKYADIELGTLILRGETISTLCQMPLTDPIAKKCKKVELVDIIEQYTEEQEKIKKAEIALRDHLAERGLLFEGQFDESWAV